MQNELEPDIQHALEATEQASDKSVGTENRNWMSHVMTEGQLAAVRLSDFAQENPLWALGAAVGVFGCGLLCPYFATIIGGGLVWWCVKRP